jgi:hypothetical protein
MITTKSQLQQDIDTIDKAAESAVLAFSASAFTLNNSYDALWNLPKDRLLAVLQRMYDDNTLASTFERHNYAAAAVNQTLGYNAAKVAAPLEIIITDGVLSFPEVVVVEEEETIALSEVDSQPVFLMTDEPALVEDNSQPSLP